MRLKYSGTPKKLIYFSIYIEISNSDLITIFLLITHSFNNMLISPLSMIPAHMPLFSTL